MLAFDRRAPPFGGDEGSRLQCHRKLRMKQWTKPFSKTISSLNSFKLWGENTVKVNTFQAHLAVWVFFQDKVPTILPYLSFYYWFQAASTCCRILWPPWHKGHLEHWHTLFVPEKQRETRKKNLQHCWWMFKYLPWAKLPVWIYPLTQLITPQH